MPITVQHQPNISQIGQVAYRTGQLQYADRRRQEEEARLLKARQMAIQQQQFGQKMAMDVWSRQFGQAGAMQQLMVQNQMAGQRAQAQQQFHMERLDVGHQNNLALDEIQNMQQVERDLQNNQWKEGTATTLFERQARLDEQIATRAAQEWNRQQDLQGDRSRTRAFQQVQAVEDNRLISGMNSSSRGAYVQEMEVQTNLENARGTDMSEEDYTAQMQQSQQRQEALVSNRASYIPAEGEPNFRVKMASKPGWTMITPQPGQEAQYELDILSIPKYAEMDLPEAKEAYIKDNSFSFSEINAETGEEVVTHNWLPDMITPDGGKWMPVQQQQSQKTVRLNSQIDLYDRRIKHNGDQRKALFVERETLEDESGEIPESNAVLAAVIDERIGRNREEADTLRAGASNIFAQLGGDEAPPGLPPGMRPDPDQPDLQPGPGMGGFRRRVVEDMVGMGEVIGGRAEGLLGEMDQSLPGGQGTRTQPGARVAPPRATDPKAVKGTKLNPIHVFDENSAQGLKWGTNTITQAWHKETGEYLGWQPGVYRGGDPSDPFVGDVLQEREMKTTDKPRVAQGGVIGDVMRGNLPGDPFRGVGHTKEEEQRGLNLDFQIEQSRVREEAIRRVQDLLSRQGATPDEIRELTEAIATMDPPEVERFLRDMAARQGQQ